ncbi:MAG: hypothetical protein ABF289_18495 [Clostridiales bacterium]
MDENKKVYGRDKRIDFAKVEINKKNKVLDKHLLESLLECIYLVIEKNDMKGCE